MHKKVRARPCKSVRTSRKDDFISRKDAENAKGILQRFDNFYHYYKNGVVKYRAASL